MYQHCQSPVAGWRSEKTKWNPSFKLDIIKNSERKSLSLWPGHHSDGATQDAQSISLLWQEMSLNLVAKARRVEDCYVFYTSKNSLNNCPFSFGDINTTLHFICLTAAISLTHHRTTNSPQRLHFSQLIENPYDVGKAKKGKTRTSLCKIRITFPRSTASKNKTYNNKSDNLQPKLTSHTI